MNIHLNIIHLFDFPDDVQYGLLQSDAQTLLSPIPLSIQIFIEFFSSLQSFKCSIFRPSSQKNLNECTLLRYGFYYVRNVTSFTMFYVARDFCTFLGSICDNNICCPTFIVVITSICAKEYTQALACRHFQRDLQLKVLVCPCMCVYACVILRII